MIQAASQLKLKVLWDVQPHVQISSPTLDKVTRYLLSKYKVIVIDAQSQPSSDLEMSHQHSINFLFSSFSRYKSAVPRGTVLSNTLDPKLEASALYILMYLSYRQKIKH